MTRDEVLSAALNLFQSHFKTDDPTGSMTAARAGLLLKKFFPSALRDGGFEKFSDLLRELDDQGHLRTGLDSKRVLAIWMRDAVAIRQPFRPLRDEIWRAFIARRPIGNRYFSRITGEVRLGLNGPPEPPQQWIPIFAVSDDEQKQWAIEFLSNSKIDDQDINKALSQDAWYRDFSLTLERINRDAAHNWKRLRSEKVLSHISDWCRINGIDPSAVYQKPAGFSHVDPQISEATKLLPSPDVRTAILTALSRMPTGDLLNLPIPARLILNALNIEHDDERPGHHEK